MGCGGVWWAWCRRLGQRCMCSVFFVGRPFVFLYKRFLVYQKSLFQLSDFCLFMNKRWRIGFLGFRQVGRVVQLLHKSCESLSKAVVGEGSVDVDVPCVRAL